MVAVLAAGAVLTVGAPLISGTPAEEPDTRVQEVLRMAFSTPTDKITSQYPVLVPPRAATADPGAEARKMQLALQLQQQRAAQAAQAAEAERQRVAAEAEAQRVAQQKAAAAEAARKAAAGFARPAAGRLTSGFGARWGTTHYGIDIANSIGTPIVSVAPGTVIEAGPASGFGLWVRVQHDDGTVTIYGHVNEIKAGKGTRVGAGQLIATVGNRGQSTGPHVHFEVWLGGSNKVDPLSWLRQRGVSI
ncbi:M23 family metallopeptidase [Actinokineospora sp. HBU206404]|uniref:M23 family metallopeptidase n=2 Tax=Actinokineospora xionganensis TaxID=2684470 RepID=A0ABR7L4N0_9PSEU|nr:M23 family metallopeptidase [Actinokineospora xionganensis]